MIARALVLLLFVATWAQAQDVRVMTSGGFTAPYLELIPEFEKTTTQTVSTAFGASMGGAPDSIPSRLERGEPVDVVILAAPALEALIEQGKVVAGSRVDLVRSTIGMAVRAGAPRPDISTVDALKKTLLEATSIAYSASASGTYLSTELFPKLGIAEQIAHKATRIESERVGTVVARSDAEIGFQQVSELLPIAGIDYVGPLPEAVQRVTVFSAGIATGARSPEAARALIRFLASEAAAGAIRRNGLEPIAAAAAASTLQVMSAGAVESGLLPLVEQFQRESGHVVSVAIHTSPQLAARLKAGNAADVLIAPVSVMNQAIAAGRVVPATRATVGRVGAGAVVRQGAAVPDTSSADALRRALLDATAVVYNTASTGTYLEGLFAKLGIADAVAAKAVRVTTGEEVMERILAGSGNEIGFGALTVIRVYEPKGLRYAGPLPDSIQNFTTYDAAVMAAARDAGAAGALVRFLTTSSAQQAFLAVGVERAK